MLEISCCGLSDFTKFNVSKNLAGIPSECQNSLDPDQAGEMSGLACVPTVCKDYQQMTLAGKELNIRRKDSCHSKKDDFFFT